MMQRRASMRHIMLSQKKIERSVESFGSIEVKTVWGSSSLRTSIMTSLNTTSDMPSDSGVRGWGEYNATLPSAKQPLTSLTLETISA